MGERKRLAVNMIANIIAFGVQFGVSFVLTQYVGCRSIWFRSVGKQFYRIYEYHYRGA